LPQRDWKKTTVRGAGNDRTTAARHLFQAALVAVLAACASAPPPKTIPGTNLVEKHFSLPPRDRAPSGRSVAQVEAEVNGLNAYLGSYPPRLLDESHRTATYEAWSQALVDVWAMRPAEGEEERVLYLLGELYRQGHNLDVTEAAHLAEQAIEGCIGKFPETEKCRFSASYFYLSLGPKYLARAQQNLDWLRMHFEPRVHPEVERGYVYLHVFRRDPAKAATQINYFLSQFPGSPERNNLLRLRQQLGLGIGYEER
jgi:hypothetical protein